jgi:hypothetical protein
MDVVHPYNGRMLQGGWWTFQCSQLYYLEDIKIYPQLRMGTMHPNSMYNKYHNRGLYRHESLKAQAI